MALWYCGSVQYAAVAQYANLHIYAVGDIVRQLAVPTVGNERCFRCTTLGTSGAAEPTWILTKGSTTTAGTAVFTEVTGNATWNWAAPFARIWVAAGSASWLAAGDTLYVASDHAATQASTIVIAAGNGTAVLPVKIICVTAAGSVPPVSADLRYTATETSTGGTNITIGANTSANIYWYFQGITFSCATGAVNSAFSLHQGSQTGGLIFNRCGLVLGGTGNQVLGINASAGAYVILQNTTVTFNGTGQSIQVTGAGFQWLDTPSALGGATFPTTLFTNSGGLNVGGYLSGVDLSALGSGKTIFGAHNEQARFTAINCKLGASVTVGVAPLDFGGSSDLIVSDSAATTYRQERYQYGGTLTTETTFVLTGGASDGTPISWKVVTNANNGPLFPFECFQIGHWNTVTGSLVTATVEIENGGITLTNADVWMDVEYLSASGTPLASVVSTAPADILAAPASLPTSAATWGGGLGSAVKQYLQVTFTPQLAGLVRATVRVGKASQTLYINPQLTLT